MKKILPPSPILVPDNAKLVFKGEIFNVYQWSQKMFDGSEATFELLRRSDTVQVIAVKGDKIILVDDEQPDRASRIHFPGGRVDKDDESWEASARRELLEETGLSFRQWRLVYVQQPIPKVEWFVPWFIACDLESEVPQKLDNGEKIKVLLKDFDTVRSAILNSNESTLNYALPLFAGLQTLDELLALPEFRGQEADR